MLDGLKILNLKFSSLAANFQAFKSCITFEPEFSNFLGNNKLVFLKVERKELKSRFSSFKVAKAKVKEVLKVRHCILKMHTHTRVAVFQNEMEWKVARP